MLICLKKEQMYAVDRLVILMAVENDPEPLVFIEDDMLKWVDPLIKAIQDYKKDR